MYRPEQHHSFDESTGSSSSTTSFPNCVPLRMISKTSSARSIPDTTALTTGLTPFAATNRTMSPNSLREPIVDPRSYRRTKKKNYD
ncbi:hypothetical protein ABW21_db0203041 [Orbilia brochopaga]|nr:hypothetical protein ABW21_db0203041 [Drechslerella brochopaga]